MRKTSGFLIMAATVALATSGCSRIRNTEGYIIDKELVAAVQPGVDNKQSVRQALGRPTLASEWNDNVWYYISRDTRQLAFARPRPSGQTVLIVTFAGDGTVDKVEQRGMEMAQAITPNRDKTKTLGRDQSLFDDLFGNIGQIGGMPGGGAGGPP